MLLRDEASKNPPSILATITATDKDTAVMAMEKMIRDLEISLRTKEQQNDDLKVQLAQKTEEVRHSLSVCRYYTKVQLLSIPETESD